MKSIEIIINSKGKSTVQTKGFAGESCREASKLIEQALGNRQHEILTAEFHQSVQTNQQSRQQA